MIGLSRTIFPVLLSNGFIRYPCLVHPNPRHNVIKLGEVQMLNASITFFYLWLPSELRLPFSADIFKCLTDFGRLLNEEILVPNGFNVESQ
jgi:hypothetical protein